MANLSSLIDCLTDIEIKLSMKTLRDFKWPLGIGKLNIYKWCDSKLFKNELFVSFCWCVT